MKAAIIDIGSGSVRLLLGGKKTTIMTKLGEGLNSSGRLSEAAMTRTIEVIKSFAEQARSKRAKVYAFATEAVRAAENRGEFLARLERECKVSVDVISGYEEAEIAFLGVGVDGLATVIDIGGASVEIVSGSAEEKIYQKSLPLGMVRLTELSGGSAELARVLAERGIAGYGKVPVLERVIGVGGTFTSLAAMRLGLAKYDPTKVQGYVLTKEGAEETAAELISLGNAENISARYPVLPPMRTELITSGAIFVVELMNYLGISSVTVSESDNLDGYVRYKGLNV